jgi:hypothetical protein
MHLTAPNKPINAKWLIEEIQSIGAAIQYILLWVNDLGLDVDWMCAPLFCPGVVCVRCGCSQ